MDGFEFVFTLYGLLLGFSLIEVIAGFGRAMEIGVRPAQAGAAPPVRIGWLSPLLGLFVIFNLVSFWTGAWSLRDVIPVHYLVLLFGLVVGAGIIWLPCWSSREISRTGPISTITTSK